MNEVLTFGRLKEGTPFEGIFPDRSVPLRSVLPIIPREVGSPPCYLVPGDALSEEQVEALAQLLPQWSPECQSIEQARAYIREDSLPLKVEWFEVVGTTDPKILALLDPNDRPISIDDDWDLGPRSDEEDWAIEEQLRRLELFAPPRWDEYDAYLQDGGSLEYEDWLEQEGSEEDKEDYRRGDWNQYDLYVQNGGTLDFDDWQHVNRRGGSPDEM